MEGHIGEWKGINITLTEFIERANVNLGEISHNIKNEVGILY